MGAQRGRRTENMGAATARRGLIRRLTRIQYSTFGRPHARNARDCNHQFSQVPVHAARGVISIARPPRLRPLVLEAVAVGAAQRSPVLAAGRRHSGLPLLPADPHDSAIARAVCAYVLPGCRGEEQAMSNEHRSAPAGRKAAERWAGPLCATQWARARFATLVTVISRAAAGWTG